MKDKLSPRQREIIRLAAKGKTNKEIASDLSIRVSTVAHHMAIILARLQARSRTEAAVKFLCR